MVPPVTDWLGLTRNRVAAIESLPDSFTLRDLRRLGLLVHESQLPGVRLEIYYAPFDYVNEKAQLAIVGITPGLQQMEIGLRQAQSALLEGLATREACQRAKQHASFAGRMRTNLVEMLDELGLPPLLGPRSTGDLFGDHCHLLHTTSAVRYPLFVNDANYTGHSPKLLRIPVLRGFVEHVLGPELRGLHHALIVPLGRSVFGGPKGPDQSGLSRRGPLPPQFSPSLGNQWA